MNGLDIKALNNYAACEARVGDSNSNGCNNRGSDGNMSITSLPELMEVMYEHEGEDKNAVDDGSNNDNSIKDMSSIVSGVPDLVERGHDWDESTCGDSGCSMNDISANGQEAILENSGWIDTIPTIVARQELVCSIGGLTEDWNDSDFMSETDSNVSDGSQRSESDSVLSVSTFGSEEEDEESSMMTGVDSGYSSDGVEVMDEGFEECQNCRRRGSGLWQQSIDEDCSMLGVYLNLGFRVVDIKNIGFGRKMCLMKRNHYKGCNSVTLCYQCSALLARNGDFVDVLKMKGITVRTDGRICWPTFVWSLLSDETYRKSYGLMLWRFIPNEWRLWWLDAVKEFPEYDGVTVDAPPPFYEEVTRNRTKLQFSIKNLQWYDLITTVDQFGCIPRIRCPWGCAEFLNKGNALPLDTVFGYQLSHLEVQNGPTGTRFYSAASYDRCMEGTRDDALNTFVILHNKKWKVVPSIAFFDGKGPSIVCCSEHSVQSRGKYVHPPTNPFGQFMSCASDQCAPVVPIPRSVRSARAKAYSDRYQLNKLEGQFSGVDNLCLSNRGDFSITDRLGVARDALAMAHRADLREHVNRLADVDKVIPNWWREEKLEAAMKYGTDTARAAFEEEHCKGATFMSLSDSLQMEHYNKWEQPSVITVSKGDTTSSSQQVTFVGGWPKLLTWVHPATGRFGATMPRLPTLSSRTKLDYRLLWCVVALLTTHNALWQAAWEKTCTENDWMGYILTFATKACFPDIKIKSSKNNPFRTTRSEPFLQRKLYCISDPAGASDVCKYAPEQINRLFCEWGSVVCELPTGFVSVEQWEEPQYGIDLSEKTVLIATRHSSDATVPPALPLMQKQTDGTTWELRAVVATTIDGDCKWDATVFRRHGEIHSGWWKQSRKARYVTKTDQLPFTEEGYHWDVALFVKTETPINIIEARDRYLVDMGGQTRWYCSTHSIPLVAAGYKCKRECLQCSKVVQLLCPVQSCPHGLCKEHSKSVAATGPLYVPARVRTASADGAVMQELNVSPASSRRMDNCNDIEQATEEEVQSIERHNARNREMEHDANVDNAFEIEPLDDAEFDTIDYESAMATDHSIQRKVASVASGSGPSNEELSAQENDSSTYDASLQDMSFNDVFNEGTRDRALDNFVTEYVPEIDYEMPDDIACDSPCEKNDSVLYPSTMSGKQMVTFDCDRKYIGSHVIFNKHGSLLIRKRSKLKGTKNQQRFLQSIVSTSTGSSIPLVYPEGMVFPSIFWKDVGDGSIAGAIPSALLADDQTLRRQGMASLRDHIKTRLRDPSLLTSTDHRYHSWAFDAAANLSLRGQDSRLILSRGYAEMQSRSDGVKAGRGAVAESFFDNESMDSRPNVNKLGAALGEKMGTFFYTHTANMSDHFGIRVIKQWLDSEEAIDAAISDLGWTDVSYGDRMTLKHQLQQSSCSLALRCWANVSLLFIKYITDSPDHPISEVLKYWIRAEFQTETANLFHLHCILWLLSDDGSREAAERICEMIRAASNELVRDHEVQEYLNEGIVSSYDELIEILDKLERFLRHRHDNRCLIPKPGGAGSKRAISDYMVAPDLDTAVEGCLNDEYVCKYPDVRLLSRTPEVHSFLDIQGKHSDEALEIMEKIGLAELECDDWGGSRWKTVRLHPDLRGRRLLPTTCGADPILSPVISKLAIMNPCSSNAQYLDSYGVSRYLAKYVAYVDQSNRIYIRPTSATGFDVKMEKSGNTKITGVKIKEKEKSKKKPSRGRMICQTELIMDLLDIPTVYTNMEFVHVPTVPLEERPAFQRTIPLSRWSEHADVYKRNGISNLRDVSVNDVLPLHVARRQLTPQIPDHRHLLPSELILAVDQLLCPLSIDGVTIFGARPPELRFLMHQSKYLKWFTRKPLKIPKQKENSPERDPRKQRFVCAVEHLKLLLHSDYRFCTWIDSTLCVIKIRAAALTEILHYIQQAPQSYFNSRSDKAIILAHFTELERFRSGSTRTSRSNNLRAFMLTTFVDKMDQILLPVVWFTNIKPTQADRFLIHILLSMGAFQNEVELMSQGSIRNAFIHAGLFNSTNPEESVNQLVNKYVLEQLKNQPGGTKQFDKHETAAYEVLSNALIHQRMSADGLPGFLYSCLKKNCETKVDDAIEAFLYSNMECVITQVKKLEISSIPSARAFRSIRTPVPQHDATPAMIEEARRWTSANVSRAPQQPIESFEEQQRALAMCRKSISQYADVSNRYTPKSCCCVGDPGAGKTTVMQLSMLDAWSFGLNSAVTALLSERAIQLGGKHVHWLLTLPVHEGASPGRLAELAIGNLFSKPWRIELLRRLDVLFFDELGQMAAEFISVMDIIFRRVRGSTRFMGGVLIIATMDIMQLLPIQGRPPLLSAHMITSFVFSKLVESVRAARDVKLKRINKIARMMPHQLTKDVLDEFKNLIMTSCRFVDDYDDPTIPADALFVFGKKAPGRKIQNSLSRRMRKLHPRNNRICISVDTESVCGGDWKSASQNTTAKLDNKVKEPSELHFFPRAVYEITYNEENSFSQSQLAILLHVPKKQEIENFKPIELFVAPSGTKVAPPVEERTEAELTKQKWVKRRVKACAERPINLGNRQQGMRRQYGLRLRVASTTHAVMGQTLNAIVTRVVLNDPNFSLWEKAQVIVLLSRTHYANRIIFVGNKKETAAALAEIIQKTTQYVNYICQLLDTLMMSSQDNTPIPIRHDYHPFRPRDIPLPQDTSGCCYLLVSCADLPGTPPNYIGECSDMGVRLNKHNAGTASLQTAPKYLHPWHLYAYVTGFGDSVKERQNFESEWKGFRSKRQSLIKRPLTADEVVALALQIIARKQTECADTTLRLVSTTAHDI